jgi:hypothetical protein
MRFGPGRRLFGVALFGLGLVVAFFLTGRVAWWLPVLGLLALLLTVPGWNWYRLDADGVHRRGIAGSKHLPWEAIDTVLGHRVTTSKGGDYVLTQFVVDAHDRPLMRLDSWIGDRTRLVRLILATASARRQVEPPPRRLSEAPADPLAVGRESWYRGGMSRTRAIVSLLLGGAGVLVGLGVAVLPWLVLPALGARLADTAGSVRTSVRGLDARLGTVDVTLLQTVVTLQAFDVEHEGDAEAVTAERQRLRAALAPVALEIGEDLQAVEDVARGIDDLLRTLDLPFLHIARRAEGARTAAIAERVPGAGDAPEGGEDDDQDWGVDLVLARRLLGEARARVAAWRSSLVGLHGELSALEDGFPRVATSLSVLVSLLALWGLVGQACLVGSGRRALRRERI